MLGVLDMDLSDLSAGLYMDLYRKLSGSLTFQHPA